MTNNLSKKPIIITGLSGAGISTVLKAMEDFKFEVFDNLPLHYAPQIYADTPDDRRERRVAIGVDTRTRGFSPEAVLQLAQEMDARLVFITCAETILKQRFNETRRRHPLAMDKSISYGIKKEREMLRPIRDKADIVIDSTHKSIHDLRHMLEGYFFLHPEDTLTVSLMSFGFKHGIPREADIVMDVRFLRNPHWDAVLKPMTGLDADVGAYVKADEDFDIFLTHFKTMLEPLLSRYAKEGKSYLTIAIGCTGGRHRSVFTVETLKRWFDDRKMPVYVEHRDLPDADS